jgi:phosphatidylglycerol:prolipoprotein diacylglycerol transferase
MYPILFHIGPLPVFSYAVFLLLAIAVGAVVLFWEARRRGVANERTLQISLGAFLGGIAGAKLSMVFFLGPEEFLKNLSVLAYSGQAFSGALIGGYLGAIFVKHRLGLPGCPCDLFAVALPLGQAIGRVGSLLSGSCNGAPADLAWAVTIQGVRRHPAQLYEMALDLVLFALVLRLRDRVAAPGDLLRFYVGGYALVRFAIEFYREDPRLPIGLTAVQVLCLLGIWGFYRPVLGGLRRLAPSPAYV